MSKKPLKIKYSELYGLREEKYGFLEKHDIKNTKWQELELKEPYFWFVPKNPKGEEKYQEFISVKDIFEKYNAGIATGKDDILVDFNKEILIRKLSTVNKTAFEALMRNYKVDEKLAADWYEELKKINIGEEIKIYNYRPFDNRFIIYNPKILQRARRDIMDNFLFDNLGVCITKQLSTDQFCHSLITNTFTDRCYISLQTKEVGYIFPLYLYSENTKQKSIFKNQSHLDLAGVQKELDEFSENKKSNIKTEIINKLSGLYNKTISPEEIFYYIYAVLYSNIYRKTYNEFLKIDFPRIPFSKDLVLFNKLTKLGEELVNLHLLKSEKLQNLSVKFPITGDSRVKKRQYEEKSGRIYINDSQYFEGIMPEIWNYYIGGYQVLDKWLKDRIDKVLSPEDVNHFLKIITALGLTIEIQKEIDKLYPEVEKNLI